MKSIRKIAIFSLAYIAATAVCVAQDLHSALFKHMASTGLILGINTFSKEEKVAFDQVLEGFNDALVMSNLFAKYETDQTTMERTGDIIWRPMPYIMNSYAGNDQTANFGDVVQLAVPATIGFQQAVPFKLTARELRDMQQSNRLGEGAKTKLASDINISCSNLAALTGTLFVKRTAAASGFDDVALAEAIMNEQGVGMTERKLTLSTRDYNSMASNLANRQVLQAGKTLNAYEKASIGEVSSFDTYKLDYAFRLTAAAGVTVTVNGANQRYVPVSGVTTATGTLNVDNRFQNLTVGVVSGTVKIGDAFTIAGVNAVHHITKQDTGQLKTFRVAAIVSGAGGAGVIQISPPIISADSAPTAGELQYKNVTAAPANGAAITFLNTTSALVNPFWQADAFEILPGRLAPAPESGLAVMRGTTDNGIELLMTRQGNINDLSTKYRFDTLWGLVNKQPQMTGAIMFGQA